MVLVHIGKTSGNIRKIEVSGHAMSGEYGQDLVCAGVSAILIGALNALDLQYPEQCVLEMKNNRILIQTDNTSVPLQSGLKMLEIQLQTIADDYPENIRVNKKEV